MDDMVGIGTYYDDDDDDDDEVLSLSSELSLCSIEREGDEHCEGRQSAPHGPEQQQQQQQEQKADGGKRRRIECSRLCDSACGTSSLVSKLDVDRNCACLNFFEAPTQDAADFAAALGVVTKKNKTKKKTKAGPPPLRPPPAPKGVARLLPGPSETQRAPSPSPAPAPSPESLRNWLDDALSPGAEAVQRKRGRKPLPMSPTERAELVKKRNREHAQSTRRRQRMYVEYLKSQVAAAGEADERGPLCKAVALKFLQCRCARDGVDRAEWRDVVADACVVTAPLEPFRDCRGTVANNRHSVHGVEAVIDDSRAFNDFVDKLAARLGATRDNLALVYRVKPSEIMLYGDKLMCHWTLATLGLQPAGLPEEIVVEGMMKATFNRFGRLLNVELIYDVAALTQALNQCGLLDDASPRAVFKLEEGPEDQQQCPPPPPPPPSDPAPPRHHHQQQQQQRDDNNAVCVPQPPLVVDRGGLVVARPMGPPPQPAPGGAFAPPALGHLQPPFSAPLPPRSPPGIQWMNMFLPMGVVAGHVQPVVVPMPPPHGTSVVPVPLQHPHLPARPQLQPPRAWSCR